MNGAISVKILFLAADPSDASRLRLGQELRDIKERLRIAKAPEKYQLEQRESVRVGDITQAIFDVEPNIIHFSGHGTSQGELGFENEVGKFQPVTPDALAAMFELFAKHVNCVVLNACYSEIQAQAIAQHIPFVIGMNDAIGDKAAISFAVGFYTALAANRSIEDAYKFGCVEIRLQGIPEHLKPVIYVKKDLIPDSQPRFEKASPNPFIPLNGRVEDTQRFFGREREMQGVFEVLNSGSSVVVIGEEGIGKSSLLWAICQQAKNCLQPPRQPVFLDLNEVDNEDEFYSELCHEVGIPESKGVILNRNLKGHKNKVLLSLDNVGKMTWQGFTRGVRDKLRGLAEGSNAPLKLILAATEPLNDLFNDSHDEGKTSPLEGICQEEHIQPWDETTMRAFIASRLAGTSVRFSEEEIVQLVEESGGHPRKLMQLCYRTYARYVEGVE
ncbi:nSTAND1 domain-containing NTPase [Mastigocladopsis repens]|uniref:nSTAND1 domain-containing NTPase n=1 Tax=Mastigocladopsis repens TaxID=221287 RepID=UPI0002F870D2|nr:CHAT domain-containing protein [Mastigocladopsis repens]